MKKFWSTALIALFVVMAGKGEVTIEVMDHAAFYDGYLVRDIPADAPDDGYLHIFTYLNSTKLTDEQLDQIGEHLTIDVTLYAVCDNYDRIGSVNLAFIPKGAESYDIQYKDTDPMRIEVARFITPFMNKNKEPDNVPYVYHCDNLSPVLRNKTLRETYDIWLELEIFGVPYAAQSQVKGCSGCNHVFDGSVNLITDDEPAPLCESNVFVPVVTRRSDWRADRGMNNYNASCTDEIGRTIKTFNFELEEPVLNSKIVIIMSNHGANSNGEEYNRREHFAYVDDELALQWKPGRPSCEIFRKYNTQTNGIYGYSERTDEQWQSFSNWCPGAPIPYHTIDTGAMEAGSHSITIEVPDAVFYGSDGFFPVSIYFQGDTASDAVIPNPVDEDSMEAGIENIEAEDYLSSVYVEGDYLQVRHPEGVSRVDIYTIDGVLLTTQTFASSPTACQVDIRDINGLHVAAIAGSAGVEAHKFFK